MQNFAAKCYGSLTSFDPLFRGWKGKVRRGEDRVASNSRRFQCAQSR